MIFLPAYVCVPHMYFWCTQKSGNVRSPETATMNGRKPPCGRWELDSGPSCPTVFIFGEQNPSLRHYIAL